MPSPVPLRCFDNVGTGFLVSSKDKHWLVTCAHILTCDHISKSDVEGISDASIMVLGTSTVIPIIEKGTRYFPLMTDKDGDLIDVMSIPLSEADAKSLEHFGSYALDSIVDFQLNELVNAEGFAGMNSLQVPATTKLEAQTTQFDGIRLALDKPSTPGLSGSALVSDRGLVGIIYGDIGTHPNYEAGVAVSFAVAKDSWFR